MGDFKNKLKSTKLIVAFITTILVLTALIIPSAYILGNNGEQVEDGVEFYSADSDNAVLLLGGYSQNPKELSTMARWLAGNDINVATAVYKQDYLTFEKAINYLEAQGFENKNIAVIGYDIGGFYLYNHLANVNEGYGSAILLSPYYQDFDETSIPVIDTSYVNNVDFLKSVEPLSYKQPTSIVTTTLDDIASPVLTTVMYNHISGDDILLSANRYSAIKEGISFNVLSGINHLYVPYSRTVMQHVASYLNTNMGWSVNGLPALPMLMLSSWAILPIALIGALIYIYTKVRYKFYTVSYSIDSYNKITKSSVVWYRIIASIGAVPLSYLVYKLLNKLEFSNMAQPVIISYLFCVAVLMYAIIKFSGSKKGQSVLGEVNLKPGNKGLMYSLLIGAAVLAMFAVQSATGMFSTTVTINILTAIVTLFMCMVAFYVSTVEAEALSNAKLTLTSNTIYYAIKMFPYILLLLWNMFVSRHTIALIYFRGIIIMGVVLAMGRVFMEITGHRKISATIMAVVFIIPLLVFTVPLI